MKISKEKTVADTVSENIKAADVFKKHGIDFCCGGGITIEKACAKYNVDYHVLEQELHTVGSIEKRTYDFNNWELDFLIDHIIDTHHKYVEESIPILMQYASKVAKVHGHHYSEVVQIAYLFTEVAQELSAHMKKEELILFPFIKKLVKAETAGTILEQPHFGTVDNPIQMMQIEHENAGDIFKRIALLSKNYNPPKEACNTFRALYAKLDEFERDLHQHIHLENNILFPKSLELERKVQP